MAKRVLSKAMDDAANALADAIEPKLLKIMTEIASLEFEYDESQWETFIATVTEKLPARVGKFAESKQERLDALAAIDFVDRTVRARGSDAMAQQMVFSALLVNRLFDSFVRYMNLRATRDGKDVTEEVFGRRS